MRRTRLLALAFVPGLVSTLALGAALPATGLPATSAESAAAYCARMARIDVPRAAHQEKACL
ncbi:MAG TPA: hypothetical protein VFV40_08110, partial [Nocardioides sp.]|nr:hypothetical protein [Nocardioides sp.]